MQAKERVLGRIGKVLFHRLGIVAVLIIAQIALYVTGLVVLRDSPYYKPMEWLFIVLSVLAAMWIVGNKSNPGYKIGWLIIVLGLMPFGSLAYLLLGGNHLSAFNQRRLRSMERKIRKNLGAECGRSVSLGELMGEDAACMAHYLERTTHCPVYGNTRTKYYPLGDDCYDDILSALRTAERYIFIEYFIIEEGKLWNSILDILKEKVKQGVEVRVIYDDVGSISTLPSDYPARLEKLGIHCRVFNRFVPVVSLRQNNRDHRKYMIIDGRVAFTGGINMADEYINVKPRFGHWKDSAIRLEGDAVWSMTVSFLSMWDFTHSEEEHFTPFRPAPAQGGTVGYVQPYHDCPWDNEPVGQSVYLNLIYRAKRYVYITTPYLVIDYSLTMALATAAKSGVDVRIITPHIPDKKTVFEMTRAYYEELLEAGVQVFEYTPGFIHSKNFIVDDRFATVGTVNLDYRSMFLHFENGVLLYETPSVEDIREDFLDTQTKSLMVTLEDCRSVSLPRRLFRDLLRLFAPLL
ncbi:MAG: cardiolipin synthase [Clostridiales bacterium]|nr:cardiolipin synthase [Clostridiales bacterium]